MLAPVLHIEGAEAIDPNFEFLDVLYEAGLRSLGPVWSRPNAFGHGVPFRCPSSPDTGPGLTDLGKELIGACNRLGILIDLSHLNERGFWDVAAISNAPLVATHSNAHALSPHSRNLIDSQLAAIRETGGIVGVIGPNGAGKTTLFRMITKQDKPDQGTIKIGESVHLGYVDQSRDTLDGGKTVWEEISGGLDQLQLGKREVNSRAYCAAFNFRGADQQKKVGQLSGGERNRVHLAKMLKSGANVLLLDEPTNDLDVDTLRALEEALEDFAGCAVIISHDRWFLDRIATHILAFEGDSHVEWFEGNYQDYEKDKMRRLGIESVIPQRIKYKKFSR